MGWVSRMGYFRAPRWGLFSWDWRAFLRLRFGLEMMKVPLPTYRAL
jgi:hypothetical protein